MAPHTARRSAFAALIVAFALAGAASATARAAIPPATLVVYDNDFFGPAASDILPLIADPNVRVLGLTVVAGDGWVNEETADVLRFLELARRTDIPVVRGAETPLVNSRARAAAWERLAGKSLWKGAWNDPAPGIPAHPDDPDLIPPSPLGAPSIAAAPGTAADFLIEQVHRYPHQVTIVAAGPLTDIALAIRLDPQFASLAKQLIFMGGFLDTSVQQAAGSPNTVDFNIWFDPEAAHIALTAPWETITAVGTVTNDVIFTPRLAARVAQKTSPVTAAVAKYTYPMLPLWDQMVTAIAADPTLITNEIVAPMDVDIDHGPEYGTMHVWSPATAPHLGERPVHIVLAVDEPRFVAEFVRAVQSVP